MNWPGQTRAANMTALKRAILSDTQECVRLRGMTRENAVSAQRLASVGITAHSWASDVPSGNLYGVVCEVEDKMVRCCFGDTRSGENVALALLPSFECQGFGRRLFTLITERLSELGHCTLFLGCAADHNVRSLRFSPPNLTVSIKSWHYTHLFILQMRNDGCKRTV